MTANKCKEWYDEKKSLCNPKWSNLLNKENKPVTWKTVERKQWCTGQKCQSTHYLLITKGKHKFTMERSSSYNLKQMAKFSISNSGITWVRTCYRDAIWSMQST